MIAILSLTHGEGLGAEAVLCQLLCAWGDREPRLLILAPEDSSVYELAKRKGFDGLGLSTSRDVIHENFKAVREQLPALRECRAVHAWTARGFELAWWLSGRLKIPGLGTLHDHPRAFFHGPARKTLMRMSANRLDRMVCVSRAVESACRCSGYRCETEVIHNGLNDTGPRRHSAAGKVRIGFMGMYAPWKGFTMVQKWIRRQPMPNAVWRLYGEPAPELRSDADALARDYPGQVELCGHRAPEQIFEDIDILVHASTFFDPLPTVLIEAARAAIPVVASRLGGAEEIVIDQQTGFLFDPEFPETGRARLGELVEDGERRTQFGRAARERFEAEFKVLNMTQRYETLWNRYHSV